jgi:hypothetical protein
VIAAAREVGLKVPLVVRIEGTNVELGKKLLAESGLAVQTANDMLGRREKKWSPRWSVTMSIMVNKNTRVIVQGITGSAGAFHAKQMPRVRHPARRRCDDPARVGSASRTRFPCSTRSSSR